MTHITTPGDHIESKKDNENMFEHPISIIRMVRDIKGTKAKAETMEPYVDHESLKRVIHMTMEPSIRFYMTEIKGHENTDLFNGLDVNLDELTLDVAMDLIMDKITTRKITGNDANDFVFTLYQYLVDEDDLECLEMIISRKLRCGVAEKGLKKIFGDDILTYIPYMRYNVVSPKTVKNINFDPYATSEIKMDGKFVNAITDKDDAVTDLISRYGAPMNHIFGGVSKAELVNITRLIIDYTSRNPVHSEYKLELNEPLVLMGEALVEIDGPNGVRVIMSRQEGNGLLNSAIDEGKNLPDGAVVKLILWDFVPLSKWREGKWDIPRKVRRSILQDAVWMHQNHYLTDGSQVPDEQRTKDFCIHFIEYKFVNNFKEAITHFRDATARKLEGTMIKDEDGIWQDKTVSYGLKFKPSFIVELRIKGLNPADPRGKHAKTFGSLRCESEDGVFKVDVSGMKDKVRKEIHDNPDAWIDKVISVKSTSTSEDVNGEWSLFLPRYVEDRSSEKTEANTSKEIFAEEAAAVDAMILTMEA